MDLIKCFLLSTTTHLYYQHRPTTTRPLLWAQFSTCQVHIFLDWAKLSYDILRSSDLYGRFGHKQLQFGQFELIYSTLLIRSVNAQCPALLLPEKIVC